MSYSLDECVGSLKESGFDPNEESSLNHAALCLRRLGNNQNFLGDRLLQELKKGALADAEDDRSSYSPQAIMLSDPRDGFFLRANIWPSRTDHCFRRSGAQNFAYGVPHDHNFDFLSLGYFGPGYISDYYEYDHDTLAGFKGEKAGLRFVERTALEPGEIIQYRAHRDVHAQHPPESLSVSLNIMCVDPEKAWRDQFWFDVDDDIVAGVLSPTSTETFLRVAVAMGDENALDLAEGWSRSHPSPRIRLACYEARTEIEPEHMAEKTWAEAANSSSRLLNVEGKRRLSEYEGTKTTPLNA